MAAGERRRRPRAAARPDRRFHHRADLPAVVALFGAPNLGAAGAGTDPQAGGAAPRPPASYLLLFAFSIWLQQQVNAAELRRFAPFCLAIPIVFMSYRYGWQGALLATLLNGVALMVNEPPQPESHRDLLLSLLAQSLTGLLLGPAFSASAS